MPVIGDLFNHLIVNPILNAFLLLYSLVNDAGLAIVLLTTLITFALLPLTYRQLKATKARLALLPETMALRRQHGNDWRKLQTATQELYQRHGISMPSPLLTLLIQTPIFVGLYFALDAVLKQDRLAQLNATIYPFLPQFTSMPNLDLTWLTLFDAHWYISLAMPDPSNILPLLTGILTFIQMRLAQPLSNSQETANQLTHIMQFVVPCAMALLTIVITAKFASGIALYRAVSLVLNSIQQASITGWGSLFTLPGSATSQSKKAPPKPVQTQLIQQTHRRKGRSGQKKRRAR